MKKIIALALSLVMLFTVAAAAATETAEKSELGKLNIKGKFTIKTGELPEGYTIDKTIEDDLGITTLIDAPEKAAIILSITFDETFADVERFNDVDEETLNWLKSTWTDEFDQVEFEDTETEYGTKLLVVRVHFDDGTMMGYVFTVYKGYMLELSIIPDGKDLVTEENIQAVVKFLSDMDFEPIEE